MGYRTYINGNQFFGSNQHVEGWIDFIRSQGIEVDDDDHYDGYITDVMGAITTLETIVLKEEAKYRAENIQRMNVCKVPGEDLRSSLLNQETSLLDFTSYYYDIVGDNDAMYKKSLLDVNMDILKRGKVMTPLYFVKACGDLIERDKCFSTPKHFACYKIKEGCKIHVKAD